MLSAVASHKRGQECGESLCFGRGVRCHLASVSDSCHFFRTRQTCTCGGYTSCSCRRAHACSSGTVFVTVTVDRGRCADCAPPQISADVDRHSNAHRLIAGTRPIDALRGGLSSNRCTRRTRSGLDTARAPGLLTMPLLTHVAVELPCGPECITTPLWPRSPPDIMDNRHYP